MDKGVDMPNEIIHPRIRLAVVRRTVGIILLVLWTGVWIGGSAVWNDWIAPWTSIQFVPALLAGSWLLVATLLVSALIFGRIYCSVLCPLGLVQDAFSRIVSAFRRRAKTLSGFSPPHTGVRVLCLSMFVASLLAGSAIWAGLLDPYSTFGRMGAQVLRPAALFVRDLAARPSTGTDDDLRTRRGSAIPAAAGWIALAGVGVMAAGWGRLYCNTVCPVGALLGLCSRTSPVRIRTAGCTGCRRCERMCKAHCLDGRTGTVDASRCVACFNCLDACRKGCLTYAGPWTSAAIPAIPAPGEMP
jgi:polyferredoxin